MRYANHPSGLTKYVGYREIREAFGIAPRTVQVMVRKGEFPQPIRLPGRAGGPAAFRLDEVTKWDEARQTHRRTHLQSIAKVDSSDLSPDELDDEARRLASEAVAKRTGKTVDPATVSLHLGQQISADDFVAAELDEHRHRSAALAELSVDDAAVIAAALLPALGPVLARSLPRLKAMLDSSDELTVEFVRVSSFLRLLDLATRLSDEGQSVPLNTSVLDHLAGFDAGRAMLVVARLFPSIRAIIEPDSEAYREILRDDDLLHAFALAALDDTRWPEAEARL